MKHYDSDDELERALFALDLEEPPADLRESILAQTLYRPAAAVVPAWEGWVLGVACALLVWLCIVVVRDGAAAASVVHTLGTSLVAVLSRPAVLFWLALTASTAIWLSQTDLTLVRGVVGSSRR